MLRPITLLCFLFIWCGTAQSQDMIPPPNIIWINAEDIGPAFGCYGDDYATTPNIDQMAKSSILYRHAYASAPICAPSRSCLISGIYATSLGTQHLRMETTKPDFVETFPEYLRKQANYFTTNNGKTDYNFDPAGVWDFTEKNTAPWRNRSDDRPFFSMFTIGETHEGPGNLPERYQQAVASLSEEMLHDPAQAPVPPYYPDMPETRELWAHYYDLITEFDRQVGEILYNLEEDGLTENTIVFVFADHGFGLPRYKRWLYKTGLHVPLLVQIPEKYQHLAPQAPGTETEELVSFVDFAPTTLNLAGVSIPDHMQGNAFLGKEIAESRDYVYGARSRADDMYEMSRAILNDRYIYIRHYMPYLPYIQPGFIFSDRKESFRILRAAKETGKLSDESLEMWQPKPAEELYDLQKDPQELTNLADDAKYQNIKQDLHEKLNQWMIDIKDVGLLYETEMLLRAENTSPYEVGHNPEQFDVEKILAAAEMVGIASAQKLVAALQDPDSGVRFWAMTGLRNLGESASAYQADIEQALQDDSPAVQLIAAETLCLLGNCEPTHQVYEKWLGDDRNWLALQAARSLQLIGKKSCPMVPTMQQKIRDLSSPPGGQRKYIDFNYASFTGWALEVALENCGAEIP
ncbi:MAG: sulfatase-like hydrolase/transferase [Cyclobacteriaceae bacterium]